MLTKYTLTIGGTTTDIPDECLKNWDDISFELARTDYSGVMRSYSTEFEFVGEVAETLWNLYLTDGFKAEASVAVHTIDNNHEWVQQYSEVLDFSTIEMDQGVLTINALDNSLASLLKNKKSQKYEYVVDDLATEAVTVSRVTIKNQAVWEFVKNDYSATNYVDARLKESGTIVISKEYYEPVNESSGYDGTAVNRSILNVHKSGLNPQFIFKGSVKFCFCPLDFGLAWDGTVPVAKLTVGYYDDQEANWQIQGIIIDNDITKITRHGMSFNAIVGGDRTHVYPTLDAMKAQAAQETVFNHKFGIVGTAPFTDTNYWTSNTVYEYYNGTWLNKGYARYYIQWRELEGYGAVVGSEVSDGYLIGLQLDNPMTMAEGCFLTGLWDDKSRQPFTCRGIRPLTLATAVVQSISPGTTVTISNTASILASTLFVPAEELRRISGSKVYITFDNLCSWFEAVLGYTYRINGTTLEFVHRSEVFVDTVVKVIDSFNDAEYTVNDNLIYSEVQSGYAKKDYGEINGRYEKNFTNYYSTEFALTDKKLQLISKLRADIYGIEYTAMKADNDTKDDKADEDIFVLHYDVVNDVCTYRYDNSAYGPDVCIENNKGFIAAMGNGDAVTLTMTSSDGDNSLVGVTIAAGENLFTAGELEFETYDMELPSNLNAKIQIDWKGFRYTGFIQEAECRYGKLNGVKYKLIVKDITEI